MNPYLTMAAIGIFTSFSYIVYHHGYKTAQSECKLQTLQAEKSYNNHINKVQNELYETEKAWLDSEVKKEIIYRDKVKTVTKIVKEYVEANNYAKCNVGDAGMYAINEAIRGTESKDK